MPKVSAKFPKTSAGKQKTNDNMTALIFENYISRKRTKNILNILAENRSRILLFEKHKTYLKQCNWENREKEFQESSTIIKLARQLATESKTLLKKDHFILENRKLTS